MSIWYIAILLTAIAAMVAVAINYQKSNPEAVPADKANPIKALNLLAQGDREGAIAELRHAAANGTATEIYTTLAVLYRQDNLLKKAIQINEGLLMRRTLPSNVIVEILKELIIEYRIAGNIGNAADCLNKISKEIDAAEIYVIRAELMIAHQDYDNALKQYIKYEKRTGIACDKEKSRICYLHAQNSTDKNQRQKLLRQSLAFNPLNKSTRFLMASDLFNDRKNVAGIEELSHIIKMDLIRSKEDMEEIQNYYYQYSTVDKLFEAMSARVAAETTHPVPYLYLYNFLKKKGEGEKALKLLHTYLMEIGFSAIIAKEYMRNNNDPAILRIARVNRLYQCGHCKTTHAEYQEFCNNCGHYDTVEYL